MLDLFRADVRRLWVNNTLVFFGSADARALAFAVVSETPIQTELDPCSRPAT